MRTRPFIRFDRNAIFGQMVEIWLQKLGIKVIETMELEGLEAISSMVMANLGVSIVQAVRPEHKSFANKKIALSQHMHQPGNSVLVIVMATQN